MGVSSSHAGRRHGSYLLDVGGCLVGMATKYGEIILGMLYREKNEEGNYVGGPMYHIKRDCMRPG